jgi:endoribonuclease Dicer
MTGLIATFVEEIEKTRAKFTALGDSVPQANFWLEVSHAPKSLSDVLEAFVGAMYEDSKYDYDTVRKFFNKFIAPYFQDMSLYDTYAAEHPVSKLTQLLQDKFRCQSWRLCVSPVPCGSDMGAAAITESNVVGALMIHGRNIAHEIRLNGKDAKFSVATAVLRRLQDIERDEFQQLTGCDCEAKSGSWTKASPLLRL